MEPVYQILQRKPRLDVERRALAVLDEFDSVCDDVSEYALQWMAARIQAGKSVKKYVDISAPEEIRRLFQTLHAVASNRQEIYVREFSTYHCHDSKEFEKIEGKILAILRNFYRGQEAAARELDDEQLLNLFGIYKNPAYVMVKGVGILKAGAGSVINLGELAGGIGIHSQDLPQIAFEGSGRAAAVITVENLTVFHRLNLPDTLLIYLGGYHTAVRRKFLMKVYEAFPAAGYLHFSDMDCGGFKILEDLRSKTGIDFHPYKMDRQTFEQYERFGRPLTQNDRVELKRMIQDDRYKEYREILEIMLGKGKKVEQECVDGGMGRVDKLFCIQ